ncbi:MAG: hypothetical protein ABIX01_16610 [Chitinophagaceae bacterium]
MTTTSIRKKLHDYIADTDDSKVKGMYLLLKTEIEKKDDFKLSERHIEILNQERAAHLKGVSKSYTQAEARQLMTGKK